MQWISYVQNFLKMDKFDRLLDAIEHPDMYSDQDVEAMLQDPEVKEAYSLLDKTRSSLKHIDTPDVEAEWHAFQRTHMGGNDKHGVNILHYFSRNVAAGIAMALGSVLAVASVVGLSVNYINSEKSAPAADADPALTTELMATIDTVTVVDNIPVKAPEIVVFDNEELEKIITKIAEYYGYKPEFSADAPKALRLYYRWNRTLPVDEVVENLNNFERINITVKGKTIKID